MKPTSMVALHAFLFMGKHWLPKKALGWDTLLWR